MIYRPMARDESIWAEYSQGFRQVLLCKFFGEWWREFALSVIGEDMVVFFE